MKLNRIDKEDDYGFTESSYDYKPSYSVWPHPSAVHVRPLKWLNFLKIALIFQRRLKSPIRKTGDRDEIRDRNVRFQLDNRNVVC